MNWLVENIDPDKLVLAFFHELLVGETGGVINCTVRGSEQYQAVKAVGDMLRNSKAYSAQEWEVVSDQAKEAAFPCGIRTPAAMHACLSAASAADCVYGWREYRFAVLAIEEYVLAWQFYATKKPTVARLVATTASYQVY